MRFGESSTVKTRSKAAASSERRRRPRDSKEISRRNLFFSSHQRLARPFSYHVAPRCNLRAHSAVCVTRGLIDPFSLLEELCEGSGKYG